MTRGRFLKTWACTEEESLLVDALRLQGVSFAEICRTGLDILAVKVPKEVIEKAKALVK